MSTSDVRSIDSLIRLRQILLTLSGDWGDAVHQIKVAARRIEERFAIDLPAYWKQQFTLAERGLNESLDHLSRLQSTSAGVSPAATEARMRVASARRRLALCQEKEKRARHFAVVVHQACADLNGPSAEVLMHAETNLPGAAGELASLIDHLSRYAEITSPTAVSAALPATGPAQPIDPALDPETPSE